MMVVIAILINIFIAYHFKKYLNKHRVVAAVIIVLVAVSVSIEMIILGFLINLCICFDNCGFNLPRLYLRQN